MENLKHIWDSGIMVMGISGLENIMVKLLIGNVLGIKNINN